MRKDRAVPGIVKWRPGVCPECAVAKYCLAKQTRGGTSAWAVFLLDIWMELQITPQWLVNSGAWKLCGTDYSLLTLENIPVFQLTKTKLAPDDVRPPWFLACCFVFDTHWIKEQCWEKRPSTVVIFYIYFLTFWTISKLDQGRENDIINPQLSI